MWWGEISVLFLNFEIKNLKSRFVLRSIFGAEQSLSCVRGTFLLPLDP